MAKSVATIVYAKYINTQRAALMIDGSCRLQRIDPKISDSLVVLDVALAPGGVQREFAVETTSTST